MSTQTPLSDQKGTIMSYSRIGRAALLLPLTMAAFACVELGIEPHASVSNDAYFESIGDFRAAIVGVYDQLQNNDLYGRSIPLLADIMGEDVKQNGSANRYQEFADFEGQVVTGHDFETDLWAEGYEAINMLNMMINADFTPTAALQDEYDQIMGEAYALRGLVYFDLVKFYAQHYTFSAGASHAGIPIALESDVTALPTRSTVAQVYSQVIDDFTTGIGLMNDDAGAPYKMTVRAAQALMSRVYLYMEDWTNARTMADAVINSGDFTLATGVAHINMFAGAGASSESILEIDFNATDNIGSDFLGGMYRASGYGDYLPAKDLLDLMDASDARWGWYVTDPLLTGIYASHRVNKWPTTNNTDNVPVIRLSEVYLNRAEALARLSQDAAAQTDLNLIRQRSFAAAPNVTATGQALLDEIATERRIELGYEGHRIHDLMRYKMDINRVDVTGDVAFMAYPCAFCILPIPQEEMDVNPNMTQNPQY